jgi:hypothetical protein
MPAIFIALEIRLVLYLFRFWPFPVFDQAHLYLKYWIYWILPAVL